MSLGRIVLDQSGSGALEISGEDDVRGVDKLVVERVGPYALDEVVGRGSSGVVWRAFDEVSEEVVALKMLDEATASDPMARARFARECELVGAFKHPGLVRLRATGSAGTVRYLVMDLALGATLQKRLGQTPPLTIAAGLEIVERAAEAISAMHAGGWVHRDVKPANIILGEDERPRLLDYGLAARMGTESGARLTRAGFFVGTPLYLAPEQLLGAPPAPTMDVYALGVTLYEMLVGRPPFIGDTEGLLTSKATQDAPDYRGPAPVRELLRAALARRPGKRPQDAAAFGEALAEARETADEALDDILLPTVQPHPDQATVSTGEPSLPPDPPSDQPAPVSEARPIMSSAVRMRIAAYLDGRRPPPPRSVFAGSRRDEATWAVGLLAAAAASALGALGSGNLLVGPF